MGDATTAYGPGEARERLARELPRWSLDDGVIRRRYRTQGWKGAVMVVGAIGHLAEAAWHHPEVRASYGWVDVLLSSHDAGGVTDRDFALAARIEEVVCWRPATGGGPLTGPPDDPRFAYVLPDD